MNDLKIRVFPHEDKRSFSGIKNKNIYAVLTWKSVNFCHIIVCNMSGVYSLQFKSEQKNLVRPGYPVPYCVK